MDHSIRGYLKRIPISKLNTLVIDDYFEDTYEINDALLQDILEVLIARKSEPGSDLLPSIDQIRKLQAKQKKTE